MDNAIRRDLEADAPEKQTNKQTKKKRKTQQDIYKFAKSHDLRHTFNVQTEQTNKQKD